LNNLTGKSPISHICKCDTCWYITLKGKSRFQSLCTTVILTRISKLKTFKTRFFQLVHRQQYWFCIHVLQ